MRRRFNVSMLFVLLTVWGLVFAPPAYAYIDAGTGSYLFQLLIAGLFAGAFMIKMFWKSIKAFLKSRFSGLGKREEDDE